MHYKILSCIDLVSKKRFYLELTLDEKEVLPLKTLIKELTGSDQEFCSDVIFIEKGVAIDIYGGCTCHDTESSDCE